MTEWIKEQKKVLTTLFKPNEFNDFAMTSCEEDRFISSFSYPGD